MAIPCGNSRIDVPKITLGAIKTVQNVATGIIKKNEIVLSTIAL